MSISLIFAAILVFSVLTLLSKSVRVVQQGECVIIERLGSYSRTLTSGMSIIFPVIDQPRPMWWIVGGSVISTSRIDLRESVLEVDKQAVITRDNVSIDIDILLYIQVTDPVKAIYEVANLPDAVAQLAQTSLRNVIGEMDLDHTLGSRDIINAKLKLILDEATDKWGTKVNRVELKNITPPREIQVAMEKQMQAERERRAKVLEAEGDKQARISRSEGIRQEQINIAEGDREAQIRRAEGEASAIAAVADAKRKAIELVRQPLGGDSELAAKFLVANNYIETFAKFTQKPGDKVFIPYEASTALASLGGVAEILNAKK